MKPIDSHVHLNDIAFDADRKEIFEKIKNELDFVVNIGADLKSSIIGFDYANEYDFIYSVVGVHPDEIGEYSDEVEKQLETMGLNKKVLAIGEIGLDYHWMTRPKEEQQSGFRKQMELARRLKKPVVIHCREALEDTVNILNEFPDVKGIMHCYPGSYEVAKTVIDRYYLGIGGVLTFKNAKKMVEVVEKIPIEHLVLETDSPYLAPVPYRGKRNNPTYVIEVAKKIAEIKNISYDEVIRITNENTRKVYNI